MRLLKRRLGLPVLLALGVMLILSASFLAVQFWSGKTFRGAAQALEAPVLPPSMPTKRKGKIAKTLEKDLEKEKTVAAVEIVNAPEVREPEEEAISDTQPQKKTSSETPKKSPVKLEKAKIPGMMEAPELPQAIGASHKKAAAPKAVSKREKPANSESEEKPLEETGEPKSVEQPVKVVKAQAKPVEEQVSASVEAKETGKKVAAKAKTEKLPATVVPAAEKVAEKSSVSDAKPAKVVVKQLKDSAKKPSAKRKAARVVDESVVPPEWNWFNTPLKLEIRDGHFEIVADEQNREVVLIGVSATLSDHIIAEPLSGAKRVDLAAEKPFVAALARMARMRQARVDLIQNNPELEKAIVSRRSEVLAELRREVASLSLRMKDRFVSGGKVAVNEDVARSGVDLEHHKVAYEEAAREVEMISSEPLTVSLDTLAVDEPTVESYRFKPHYGGSGTDLSNRINELLKQRQVSAARP